MRSCSSSRGRVSEASGVLDWRTDFAGAGLHWLLRILMLSPEPAFDAVLDLFWAQTRRGIAFNGGTPQAIAVFLGQGRGAEIAVGFQKLEGVAFKVLADTRQEISRADKIAGQGSPSIISTALWGSVIDCFSALTAQAGVERHGLIDGEHKLLTELVPTRGALYLFHQHLLHHPQGSFCDLALF